MMGNVNCLRCRFRHEDNGNCTAIGGFCTAVPAAHCPLLREYLDTGLTPEDIAQMQETQLSGMDMFRVYAALDMLDKYQTAEKDGRLVVLPAKTVFELTWDAGPDCDLVCPVSIDDQGCCNFCDHGELCIYERKCRQEHIEQIGKTVFLTREAAEAALEAMKDE